MISVVCWRWGKFGPGYVNRLQAMLRRHLHLPHRLFCITDDGRGLSDDITVVPMPPVADAFRCRRRMWQFASERRALFGPRMLCMDLDVVIVDDITPLVDREEPLVMWKVGYAKVYSGSFILMDTGALDGAWRAYQADPAGYLRKTGLVNASDQAMLNHYLRGRKVPHWTDGDGIVTFFGRGYEQFAHLGAGPETQTLPKGARLVVLGSEDVEHLEAARLPWIREHWAGAIAA